ncbi:MAG: hypothetical protein WBY47_07605 [Desulfobacterales bacterium]|jgi:hypothetical protein
MKKLQLFIIIYSVLVASYACAADFLITADVNGFFADFGCICQSALKVTRHSGSDKTFLFSERFGQLCISIDGGTPDFQSDIDIPEKSDIYDYGVTLMTSDFEGAPVLRARGSAKALLLFPSEAYRLRI